MGLFSIFKRKNDKPAETDTSPPSRLKGDTTMRTPGREGSSSSSRSRRPSDPPLTPAETEAERARQREIARATAMKIDAIESAMTFDIFNTPEPAWGSGPKRPPPKKGDTRPLDTLPALELATTELLGEDDLAAPAVAEIAPVVEESAIMFANDQVAAAEGMLIESLADTGQTDRTVWWMLFDLYQIGGKQDAFDSLSIDYASRFETSPPAWTTLAPLTAEEKAYSGLTPTEAFTGVLDDTIAPQLDRLLQLATSSAVFRLEFGRVTSVTPEGCARLLAALKRLHAQQHELIVAGADKLAERIRETIDIGRRDENDAPWLLLLELLQLMRMEKEFEETAMDYCVTYEVSPPSFVPVAHVATALAGRNASPDRFLLPGVIERANPALLEAIDAYAAQYDSLVFDCLRLSRVDYGAASTLLQRLRPLAEAGKKIEFRDMNHLVAALFSLLGYPAVARLFPHKY
ncbi:MAG: STAS domain-containing protein [Pseudomonadota bacterium]